MSFKFFSVSKDKEESKDKEIDETKEEASEKEVESKPEEAPQDKPKAKTTKDGKKKAKAKKTEGKDEKEVEGPFPAVFYAKKIRRFYKDKAWHFSVDDVLALTKSPGPEGEEKFDEEKLEKAKEQYAKEITFEDGGKEEKLSCATAEEMINILREIEARLPGPFPRWIDEVSKLKLEVVKKQTLPENPNPNATNGQRLGNFG